MNAKVIQFKWVILIRSTNWVTYHGTKWVTQFEIFIDRTMAKMKQSHKRWDGKVGKTLQEKRDAMSHEEQRKQK